MSENVAEITTETTSKLSKLVRRFPVKKTAIVAAVATVGAVGLALAARRYAPAEDVVVVETAAEKTEV